MSWFTRKNPAINNVLRKRKEANALNTEASKAAQKRIEERQVIDKSLQVQPGTLYKTVMKGDVEGVRSILTSSKISPNNKNSSDKQMTALCAASKIGNIEIVRLLLEAHADIEAKDLNEETPLMLACLEGHADVVRILLEANADVNAKNIKGDTPLIFAADSGDADTVRILLKAGANINTGNIINNATPICYAAFKGHANIVRMLIEAGADVNKATKNGITPLITATDKQRSDIVRILLKAGANNRSIGPSGTALNIAKYKRNKDIISLLTGGYGNIGIIDKIPITPHTLSTEFMTDPISLDDIEKGKEYYMLGSINMNPYTSKSLKAELKRLMDKKMPLLSPTTRRPFTLSNITRHKRPRINVTGGKRNSRRYDTK
jgi:hypothetical protein